MTAKVTPTADEAATTGPDLDSYDQHLMTAVVNKAEAAGKQVKPLIVPTNNPLYAVIRTAQELGAQELVMGASNKYSADEQLEQIGFYWINLHNGQPAPLTVRILGREREVHLDLGGGNRIPKLSERRARTVAELRAAGVGADRVLLVHDEGPGSTDLFQAVLTVLDPQVVLDLAPVDRRSEGSANGAGVVQKELEQAAQLGRVIKVWPVPGDPGPELVRLAREGQYDLLIVALPQEQPLTEALPLERWVNHVLRNAPCRVFLAAAPALPQDIAE
jgi:hypothetical protein